MNNSKHNAIYFKAIVWDNDEKVEEGFVSFPTIGEALTYLSNYFEKNLITLKIHPLAEGPILLSDLSTYRSESEI